MQEAFIIKKENFKQFIHEIGLDCTIVLETWQRKVESLKELFNMKQFEILSYKRPKTKKFRQPGGGYAIFFNQNRFTVKKNFIYSYQMDSRLFGLIFGQKKIHLSKHNYCRLLHQSQFQV